MVRPSCPALVIHDDDAFRKSLIATLDQQHFTVTICPDGDAAVEILRKRKFRVVLVGVNLNTKSGVKSLEFLRESREEVECGGIIIVGDSDPNIRTYAPWANETLLKPVDAGYVVTRARSYCDCTN